LEKKKDQERWGFSGVKPVMLCGERNPEGLKGFINVKKEKGGCLWNEGTEKEAGGEN